MRLDKYPMKQNGMYILKKSDFDDIADMVLEEYMPSVLTYPKTVDIEYLAEECFYLDIKHDTIMPEGKVLGMIAFADTKFDTIDCECIPRQIELEEGTMLIDLSLIGRENRARKRFTEAHETSHWICHRSYHSPTNQSYDFRMNKSLIACRTENIEQYKKAIKNKVLSDSYWEEWQADKLAASILMPKRTFVIACSELLRTYQIRRGYLIPGMDTSYAKRIIAELAHMYDVSFKAAQIRMIDLGFIKA